MDFNLVEARKNGYTDDEIATHLADRHSFNLEAATKQGYSTTEIAEMLSTRSMEDRIETNEPRTPDWAGEHPNVYGAFGAAKEVYGQIGKPVIEAGGMLAGGAAGTPMGPAGQLAGGGLGYAISKKLTSIIDRNIGRIEGIKRRTSVADESIKSLFDIKSGLEMEMLGQGVGKILPTMIEKASAPFSKGMTEQINPRMPTGETLRNAAAERGVTLTPAEVTGSKTLGLGESLLEKAPGATDIINEMRIKKQLVPLFENLEALRNKGASQQSVNVTGRKIWEQITDYLETETRLKGDALNKMRTEIVGKLGTNESLYAVGLRGKDLLKARTVAYNEHVKEAYNSVRNHLPEGEFAFRNLSDEAGAILKGKEKLAAQDKTMLAHLRWASKTADIPHELEQKLASLPDNIRENILKDIGEEFAVKRSWQTMQDFVSDMGALSSKEDALGMALPGMKFQQTPQGAVYTRLRKAALRDMEEIAQKAGGKAWEKYQTAKSIYSEGAQIYKAKEIRAIAKSNPEDLVDMAFKPNGISEIRLLKNSLGGQGFVDLRQGFTNKLVKVGKQDVFDPEALRRELMRYGDDFLTEVYGETTAKELKKVAQDGLDLSLQRPGQSFLRAMTREYPETIVDRIIGAPEAKLQSHTMLKNIQTVKQAIGKEEFNALGDRLFEKLMSVSQESGMVRPNTFAKMVDKYEERVLRAFYPSEKVAELRTLADIGRKVVSAERIAGNPSGTGQTLIAWGVLRMVLLRPVEGAALAIAPKQIAKLYRSPFGMKWLTDGFKIPANSKKGIELATKIISVIGNEEE